MATTDLTVGGGRLFFNDGGQDGAAGNGYLDLGNIPALAIQRTVAEIEHFAFIASTSSREKDLNIVTDIGMSIAFTIDELMSENWNILLFGNGTTTSTQAGGAVTGEAATGPVLLDRSIFTAETDVSALVVTDNPATVTYTVTTDYILQNAVTGEIKIVDGGAITTGKSLLLNYTSGARTRKQILPGKDTSIKGSARLEFEGQNGSDLTWVIQNCEIKPDADTSLSSTEISESAMILNILVDKTVDTTQPFGVVYHG